MAAGMFSWTAGFRPVTGERVTADHPKFLDYLPDVQLQLVAPAGTASNETQTVYTARPK